MRPVTVTGGVSLQKTIYTENVSMSCCHRGLNLLEAVNSPKDPALAPLNPRQFANNKKQTNTGQQKQTQFWLD